MNTDTAFLSLDTYSLAGTGDINASKTNFVFRNVNMKNMIGEMWDKYDLFSIRMVSNRQYGSTTTSGSQANVLQFNVKGFDWINCYDEKYGTGQAYMPIMYANYTSAARNLMPTSNHYCLNFRKGKPIIDIEFQVSNLQYNTQIHPALLLMPDVNFTFIIQPADNNQNEMGYMGLYTNTTNNPVTWPSKVISNNARTYAYYNFDMRQVCSTFWNKYEDFELLLAAYQYQGIGTVPVEQQITPITISGFGFNNNFTKAGTNTSTSTAVVGITKQGVGVSSHESNINVYYSPVQFKKSGDTVSFVMEFRNFDNSGLNGFATATNRIGLLPFFIRPIIKDINSEKGTLTLTSAGLTTTPTDLGVTNADYTDITINNVALRKACESFWHKYNKFNIFLTAMYPNDTINALEERAVNMYCEGLQINAQMSDLNATQTSNVWNMGAVYTQSISATGNGVVTYGNTKSVMFFKSTDEVNLRFYVKEIGTPSATVSSQVLRGTMTFTIVPVEE